MSDFEFFLVFFSNSPLFLSAMFVMTGILYLSIRSLVPAAYLDPMHFFWTFTFGSAYGVVIGLFLLGQIETELFLMVFAFGTLFIVSFRQFAKAKVSRLHRQFLKFLVPTGDGKREFLVALTVYVALLIVIIAFVGFGMFAETNRFEQNRGFGPLVRVADALRLFVVAYLALDVLKRYRASGGMTIPTLLRVGFVLALIVLGSMVNGSKFALLEAIYAVVLAISIYDIKPRFKVWVALSIMLTALGFAIIVLSNNLRNDANTQGAGPEYMAGDSLVVERLFLRILANADKYYFSLPNGVIHELKTDNVAVAFAAPFVGTGRISALVGYNVDDLNIGRQTLTYFYPDYDIAGGPTSHFDLFAYKYFGWFFGVGFVLLVAALLAAIMLLGKSGKNKIFYASLAAAIWLRSQAVLLEPTVGLAYIFDIFILFFMLKISCAVFSTQGVTIHDRA